MSEAEGVSQWRGGRPRISSLVALTLLETIRAQDRPQEILQDEDPTITMPRRLGLSDVVDAQIRRYREEVRRGRRIPDEELQDLVRLVVRRPDSAEVFFRAGEALGGTEVRPRRWRRMLPRGITYRTARRRVRLRIRALLGRGLGRLSAPCSLRADGPHLFLQSDPGGHACHLLSGLMKPIVETATGERVEVLHDECLGRGGAACRWTALPGVPEELPRERTVPSLADPAPQGT